MVPPLILVHWSCWSTHDRDNVCHFLSRLDLNGIPTVLLSAGTDQTEETISTFTSPLKHSTVLKTSQEDICVTLCTFLAQNKKPDQKAFFLSSVEELQEHRNLLHHLDLVILGICHTENEQLGHCKLNSVFLKLADAEPKQLTVGYVMKWSREKELLQKGLLNLLPCEGVRCIPLDLAIPLSEQGPCDILLHKASDVLEYNSERQLVSPAAEVINAYSKQCPHICVVDPLEFTSKLINRADFTDSLQGLAGLAKEFPVPVCTSTFVLVESFQDPDLPSLLDKKGIIPPFIVKSVVACGTADSHEMAIALSSKALSLLDMHLPAVVQRYVNHSGVVFKVYVLGSHVTYSKRASIPDVHELTDEETATQDPAGHILLFNSFSALPKSLPANFAVKSGIQKQQEEMQLDMGVITQIANYIKQNLHLHFFGFDVLVENGNGTYHVVDVNYLPNYREVVDAPRLFRATLKQAHAEHYACGNSG